MAAFSCPYREEIIRMGEQLAARMPDDFAEQWGALKRQLGDVCDMLQRDGYERRLRHVEQRQAKLAGAGLVISVVLSSGVIGLLVAVLSLL